MPPNSSAKKQSYLAKTLLLVHFHQIKALVPGIFFFPGVLAIARNGPIESTSAKELSI